MIDFMFQVLTIYGITLILAASKVLNTLRSWFIAKTGLNAKCRMCVGFWVTIAVCWGSTVIIMLAAFGASYFLVTQERGPRDGG